MFSGLTRWIFSLFQLSYDLVDYTQTSGCRMLFKLAAICLCEMYICYNLLLIIINMQLVFQCWCMRAFSNIIIKWSAIEVGILVAISHLYHLSYKVFFLYSCSIRNECLYPMEDNVLFWMVVHTMSRLSLAPMVLCWCTGILSLKGKQSTRPDVWYRCLGKSMACVCVFCVL